MKVDIGLFRIVQTYFESSVIEKYDNRALDSQSCRCALSMQVSPKSHVNYPTINF